MRWNQITPHQSPDGDSFPSRGSLWGLGDTALDAEQGRALARQGENLYAARQRREQERMDEEARQAREMMAEAQRISEAHDALQNAPQGAQNALGNIYSQAEQRQSSLEGTPYADILRRGDYGRYAQAGESRLGLGAETDRTYDYINDINGFRARADEQAVMADDAQRLGIYGLSPASPSSTSSRVLFFKPE